LELATQVFQDELLSVVMTTAMYNACTHKAIVCLCAVKLLRALPKVVTVI